MTDDWVRTAPVVEAVREFERGHPGVRVDIKGPIIENVPDLVRAGIARGDPPDVVQWHAFAAGAQGIAEPLDDLWRGRIDENEYLAGAIDDVKWAGRAYGVPLDTNAMLLLYNADHAEAAALERPVRFDTFADLRRAAKALSSPKDSRRAIGPPSSTWHAYGWMRANGGELVAVGLDGRARFTFDDERNVEALGFLADLVRRKLAFPPIGRVGDRIDAFALLRAETTSLHATGSWDLAALEKEGVGDRYEVALMPGRGGARGTVMGGSSLFVPKGSEHRELAFEFMMHLTSDRYALRLAKEEGRLPVRLRVYGDSYFQTPALRTFLEQLKTASPFRLESFPAQHEAFRDALTDVLQGRRTARAALRAIQRQAETAP